MSFHARAGRLSRRLRDRLALARAEGVSVLPRGGGTSQAGQTVNTSLVVDCSQHPNRLITLTSRRTFVGRMERSDIRDRVARQGLEQCGRPRSRSDDARGRTSIVRRIAQGELARDRVCHGLTDYPRKNMHHESCYYVTGAVRINTIEGFWSSTRCRRFHKMSGKYMLSYCR